MSVRPYSSIEAFEEAAAAVTTNRESAASRPCVTVAGGTCGIARGAAGVVEAFKEGLAKRKLERKVQLRQTGCHGFCQVEPLVVIDPQGTFYTGVSADDVPEILDETIAREKIVERLLYCDPRADKAIPLEADIPFYKKQRRRLLSQNRRVDPKSIDDYIAIGGYTALARALKGMTPEQVIAEVKKAGLRGRGGAGFSTAAKWEFCRQASGSPKYLICNADEGDPGAYMDRSVLEGNPHSVIEGMVIGAHAIGCEQGYVYIRMEYPLAIDHMDAAIRQARERGLLGDDVLGSGFRFDLEITRGAGAFVCGEETALMASIEGMRGMPNPRPPYPAQSGLWGKPSNINNVETWANVPVIIRQGGDEYAKTGSEAVKGTKIFSLVGKINNTGLVEVPMGITLREIVEDIGGGVPGGLRFKAVQTGGPSGGCIPEEHLDLPVDYESLAKVGSIMGSGGMIVMDETTCMVDVARYFLRFTQEESCGKCTPCRIGTRQMADILEKITRGEGSLEDLKKLEQLAETVQLTSLCGLGQTAPNPVMTTLRYFRDEYEAHVHEKRCPALGCKDLIYFDILEEKCVGCGLCVDPCSSGAITGERREVHRIDQEKCLRCGTCLVVCPAKFEAVKKISPVEVAAS
jgi:NADH:ubiquinone oxidoreductase subunit F (NADH-binding)/(2Fe-2S) ferredoxin/ferredoxin